jgi:glycosyltransferase involved in cell wall biosynthesis
VPVGADDRVFHPPEARRAGAAGCLVGFWGTYIPLHGVATIVEAAALMRDEPVRFELAGRGQTFAETAALARRLGLANLSLSPPVPPGELARFARRCDVALGIFGETAKAARVVPHKVYQAMLSGLPVVTRDSPAVREFFRQGEHLLLVPPGDARALAEAIRRLAREPMLRLGLGHAAHACVSSRFTPGPIGERLAAIIAGLVRRRRS